MKPFFVFSTISVGLVLLLALCAYVVGGSSGFWQFGRYIIKPTHFIFGLLLITAGLVLVNKSVGIAFAGDAESSDDTENVDAGHVETKPEPPSPR